MRGWSFRALAATATVSAGLIVAGCGGGSDSSSTPTGGNVPAAERSTPAGDAPAAERVANADGPGPSVRVPKGPPPKRKLIVIDLRKGHGAEAKVGDDVTLRYVGVRWDGWIQSNSWTYPEAPTFELGTIQLAERGLDEGIRGMQVGGRREIVIPASRRAYPDIEVPVDEAIVYVVDLKKIS